MVDWGDLAEPMGPPSRYTRRLHALAQSTAGPDDDAPRYCWVVARDERGCVLPFYAEPDKKLRKLASFTAFVRLLDGPAAHPRSAVGVGEPATRPESPNAPPARPLIAIMRESIAA